MVESYAVVIYACILGDMIEDAEEIYDIMKRTTSTYKPGWLCFLRGICARGYALILSALLRPQGH